MPASDTGLTEGRPSIRGLAWPAGEIFRRDGGNNPSAPLAPPEAPVSGWEAVAKGPQAGRAGQTVGPLSTDGRFADRRRSQSARSDAELAEVDHAFYIRVVARKLKVAPPK